MVSPFIGMDPWLEEPARWQGVHQALNTYLRDEMQPRLPSSYVATIGERIYVETQGRSVYPDVMLVERRLGEAVVEYQTVGSVPIAEPIIVTQLSEPRTVPYIEIVDTETGDVVTVIEMLSPINKAFGPGREQYLKKQAEILHSTANLVEIDLLGDGKRLTVEPNVLAYRYIISVNRASDREPDRERNELYPLRLDQRLPRFRIPLRHPDPDVVVDLQAVFNECYDKGRYATLVDYTRVPRVSLSPEERAWVEQRLAIRTTAIPNVEG